MKVEMYKCDSCGATVTEETGVVKEGQELVFEADRAKVCIEVTVSAMNKRNNNDDIPHPAVCYGCLQAAVAQHAERHLSAEPAQVETPPSG